MAHQTSPTYLYLCGDDVRCMFNFRLRDGGNRLFVDATPVSWHGENNVQNQPTVARVLRCIAGITPLVASQRRLNGCRQIGQFRLGKVLTSTVSELPRRGSYMLAESLTTNFE